MEEICKDGPHKDMLIYLLFREVNNFCDIYEPVRRIHKLLQATSPLAVSPLRSLGRKMPKHHFPPRRITPSPSLMTACMTGVSLLSLISNGIYSC